MKLPHGKLLQYAKKVMHRTEDSIDVHCVFNILPSLAMFIEAAAQSSAGFDVENHAKIGFLTMAKNIKLLQTITEKEYLFRLYKEAKIAQYNQFTFEVMPLDSKIKIVTGSFTLMVKA